MTNVTRSHAPGSAGVFLRQNELVLLRDYLLSALETVKVCGSDKSSTSSTCVTSHQQHGGERRLSFVPDWKILAPCMEAVGVKLPSR